MTGDRRKRLTFDSAAQLYHQARPDYPPELYDELVRRTALRPGDQLLEIGCASGKATIPLARRGFRITCVELGSALAAEARRRLVAFPDVRIVEADFDTWQPRQGAAYDLVFAATAWHWLDPATRYRNAWTLLRPGGHLAFWGATHVFPEGATRSSARFRRSTTRSGKASRRERAGRVPANWPTSGRRSRPPGSSTRWRHAISTGRPSTPPMGTPGCSTRSPVTSRCRGGSGTACTARSGVGWRNGQALGYAVIGAPFCTWPDDAMTTPAADELRARRHSCGVA
ncbi:MAG: class I SAM-dependent methyltransferase [Micromonosporaceae bacterium]